MFGLKYLVTNPLRANVMNLLTCSNFSTFTQPLWIQVTPCLLAQPMKKKKKLDPIMTKLRNEKKRKRLWRDCRRLMKMEKQLKPLDEVMIPYHLVDNREKYVRERKALSVNELEDRADLVREWSIYRHKMHYRDLQIIDKIEFSQHRALEVLLKVSPTLYNLAVEVDESFLPFNARGVTATPPIENYDSPDGEYIDVSKKWDAPILPEEKKGLVNSRKKKIKDGKEIPDVNEATNKE